MFLRIRFRETHLILFLSRAYIVHCGRHYSGERLKERRKNEKKRKTTNQQLFYRRLFNLDYFAYGLSSRARARAMNTRSRTNAHMLMLYMAM